MNTETGLHTPSRWQQRRVSLGNLLSLPAEVAVFYAFGSPLGSRQIKAGPRPTLVLRDPNLASWWDDYLGDSTRYHNDPVRQMLRHAIAPVSWNELAPGGMIDHSDDGLWEPVRKHGIRAGLSVPLIDPLRYQRGTLSFIAFCKPEMFDEWWNDMSSKVVGAAYLFHLGLSERNDIAAHSRLSPREKQCLEGVARGMSSKKIALDLGLSPRTVDLHIARAAKRLGAMNRIEAISLAIRDGQIDLLPKTF